MSMPVGFLGFETCVHIRRATVMGIRVTEKLPSGEWNPALRNQQRFPRKGSER